MEVKPVGLKYILCPGSMPDPAHDEIYREIYRCWRETWEQAFRELKYEGAFPSDSFTRQDYVGAVFHGDRCIALGFLRMMDARRPEFETDSYFSNWEPHHRRELRSRGDKIMVCCQFTVHPSARGRSIGLSTKDLLTGILVESFLRSDADAMTGAVRVDRGVSSSTERWGGYVIDRKVPCEFGEKNTDLVGFFKDHIAAQPPHELKSLVQDLWEGRTVVPRLSAELQFDEARGTGAARKAG